LNYILVVCLIFFSILVMVMLTSMCPQNFTMNGQIRIMPHTKENSKVIEKRSWFNIGNNEHDMYNCLL